MPPSHRFPGSVAGEQLSRSSSEKLDYLSQLSWPFALAFWIAYASEIALATAKLQHEPHWPWFTTGVKQPFYSWRKSKNSGSDGSGVWSVTAIVFTSSCYPRLPR
jgi:hypothetical protein